MPNAVGGSRFTRVWRGIGSSALGQAILAAQAIILVPFYLHAWGAEGYGRWVALTALVSYLSLLDLGGQNYVANLLAIQFARGDENEFRKILSEGVSLFSVIGISALGLLGAFLWLFREVPVPGLGRQLESWEAWVLTLLGAQFLLLAIPGGVYATVYRSSGLFVRGAMIGNLVGIVSIFAFVGLLLIKVTYSTFAAGMLTVACLRMATVFWDSRRCVPASRGISINLERVRQGWRHLHGSMHFWLIFLAQVVKHQGVILVLAVLASPAIVALYATHRTLSSLATYVAPLIQSPILPEFSFLWAQERETELRHTSFVAIRAVIFLSGMVAIFLWLAAPLVYPFWTGKLLQVNTLLFFLLLLQGVLMAGWKSPIWGLLATNRHRAVAVWSLANAVFTIALAVWLVGHTGALGVALAALTGDLLFGLAVFPALASRFLEVSVCAVYGQILYGLAGVSVFAVLAVAASSLLPSWWAVAGFSMIVTILVYPTLRVLLGQDVAKKSLNSLRIIWSWKLG